MDIETYLKAMMAGSILLSLLTLLFFAGWFALFLTALIHCVNHKGANDRVTWVIIIIFVPLFGAILYFAMGRNRAAAPAPATPRSSTPVAVAKAPRAPTSEAAVRFDHAAMRDERKRADAINEALRSMSAGNRPR